MFRKKQTRHNRWCVRENTHDDTPVGRDIGNIAL